MSEGIEATEARSAEGAHAVSAPEAQPPLTCPPEPRRESPFLSPAETQAASYPGYIGPIRTPEDEAELARQDEQEPLPLITEKWLRGRHREVARLAALGKSNNYIADKLGYSVPRISILLKQPAVQAEVIRYRHKLYDDDLAQALKDMGPDAAAVMARAVRDETFLQPKERIDPAKWILEKVTGKPGQQINVESNTLSAFLAAMREMREAAPSEARPEALPDVEVRAVAEVQGDAPPQDAIAAWLDSNL